MDDDAGRAFRCVSGALHNRLSTHLWAVLVWRGCGHSQSPVPGLTGNRCHLCLEHTQRGDRVMLARIIRSRWHYTLIAFVILSLFLFPVYWMFITSIKPDSEILSYPPRFVPS